MDDDASEVIEVANPLRLDPGMLRDAVGELEDRIAARFPRQRLRTVAAAIAEAVPDVGELVDQQTDRQAWVRRVSRVVTGLLVLGTAVAIGLALVDFASGEQSGDDWLSLVNDVIADLVYVSVAAAFLWALPQRLGRRRLVETLHQLRSLAHVIDMRQLSKDPERLRPDYRPTERSPAPLTPDSESPDKRRSDLHHYLSYCVELLGMVAKTAALCGEGSSDPVVLELVNEVEQLSTDTAGKVFAKLQLLALET